WQQNPTASFLQSFLLQPKLAYCATRHPPMEPLADVLSQALDIMGQTSNEEERHLRFLRFVEFFEAVLAYHKRYGGE
ncbi:MAG: type III-A CRISPR-associated protein Csm2, partial [Anaerolineae bacterium]